MIKKIVLDKADRLYHLPFDLEDYYPKRALKPGEKKIPTIDIGRLNWFIKQQPRESLDTIGLASKDDLEKLKTIIADWLLKELRISVNPNKEIYVGQGVNRIIFDLFLAFVEYGDIVLCPEPGMPFYRRLVITSGGVPVSYQTYTRSDFKPSLSRLDTNLGNAAKILIANNPNNPVGFLYDETELDELIHIASRKNIFIVNDAAYCSFSEEKYRPLRSRPGGSKVGLEIFSIPFTFGLPYIPLGFAVGPTDIISALKNISKTIKISLPGGWISECIDAIENYPDNNLNTIVKHVNQTRLKAVKMAESSEWTVIGGNSCPFLWVRLPDRKQSVSYSAALLRRKRIITLPGTAFGETGDGYLRLSLTASKEDFTEASSRMSKKSSLGVKKETS
jgi:LL-diaminopimelate aminotransferase